MFRTSILALIFGFTSVGVFAEDARQLTYRPDVPIA
jgi:hypothetical protein